MAISVVQSASSGASNPPLSFASSVTAGNSVFLIIQAYNTSGTSPSVAASSVKLNSATVTGTVAFFNPGTTGGVNSALSGNVAWISVWMLPNCLGVNSVDFTITGAAGVLGIEIYEVAGLGSSPSLDQSSSGSSTSLTTASSGATGAITAAPEFIIGGAMIFTGASAPAGWTTLNPSTDAWAGYQIATSSGGTYTWSQSSAGTPWAAAVATVQGTPVAPPPVQVLLRAPYRPSPPGRAPAPQLLTGPLPAPPAALTGIVASPGMPFRVPLLTAPQILGMVAGSTTQATAALSGSGSLTAAPVLAGTVTLSGSGTLTAATTTGTTVTLSGSGTLSAATTTGTTAALSGSGSLTALWTLKDTLTLSGSGTLNVSSSAGSANLTGSGTLTASPQLTGSANLTGAGTLTAAPSQILPATATLSGAGTLTAAETLKAVATFAGLGTLSILVIPPPLTLTAADSRAGTLTASDVRAGGPT